MNTHEDTHLLWELRALRREHAPSTDLWPGIAARIAAQSAPGAGAAGNVVPLRRRRLRRMAPWALAASLALAVGVAWQLRPDPAATPGSALPAGPVAAADAGAPPARSDALIRREAEALAREYAGALRELEAAGKPALPLVPMLHELDASADQIRTALEHDPDARFLLERLRRTYEKRLELTQRAILS